MAQTETKVAQVTLKDAEERNQTISIDNPKDNLSLNQIKMAFQPAINGGWLISNSGSPITEVVEAKYNQVIKTQIDGVPVTVSPSSFDAEVSSSVAVGTSTLAGTLTVTNGVMTGVSCPSTNGDAEGFVIRVAGYNSAMTSATVAVTRTKNIGSTFSSDLKVFIEGSNNPVTVPISVTQTEIS